MNLNELIGVGVGFTVIGGALVGVVRYLDKGRLVNDIEQLKKVTSQLTEDIKDIKKEVKDNAEKDQVLREKVLVVESTNNNFNNSLTELKEMLSTVLEKLEERQESVNKINQQIAVLQSKVDKV